MKFSGVSLIGAVFALSACGGSSSTNLNFAEVDSMHSSLIEDTQAEHFRNYTNLNSLPQSSVAKYEGAVTISDPGFALIDPTLVGVAQVSLNFETDTLSGTADNFYFVVDRQRLGGELDINAALNRTANTTFEYSMFGTMDGRLTGPSGFVDIDIPFLADSYREEDQFLFGLGNGTLTTSRGLALDASAAYVFERTDE